MFPKSSPQRDGDELLLSLLMATSRVQDLQHLPSLVASFPGLGTPQSLGVPGGVAMRDPAVTLGIPTLPQMQPSGFWSVLAPTWAWPAKKWR